MFIKRAITSRLLKAMKSFPALLLTGCRQAGKTTLLQHLAGDYDFVTMDAFSDLEQIKSDVPLFFANHPPPLIIDEIQYAPEILRYIKVDIDRHRKKMGQYLLTGSQIFPLMKGVSESLAGRVALFEMYPLSWAEISPNIPDYQTTLYRMVFGFFPEIVSSHDDPGKWIDSYLMTYINRDVRMLRPAIQISSFQRFLRILAARAGQLLNLSEIAKEMGISQPTVKEWLEILEATYVIYLLRPYFSNRTKRFIKSPKVYFVDTGILSYLLGIQGPEQLAASPFVGHIFENMVVMEALKRTSLLTPRPELYFYRSIGGVEIDLIIEQGHEKELYEIKWSKEPNSRHLDSMKRVVDELKPKKAALLTLAEETYFMTPKIQAEHWFRPEVL
jgi:hypothetical protein